MELNASSLVFGLLWLQDVLEGEGLEGVTRADVELAHELHPETKRRRMKQC